MRTVCVQRASKALFIRTLRWANAVHSLPACDVFHNLDLNCFFNFFMVGLCVVYVWLGQTSVNENTTNLERVLYLCLTLDWRWSDVLLASTFKRGKTLTFLSMQKMCALVDAHKKWMTFIRRFRQIIKEFWRTPSESQRTDQNSSFFVRWTCVMVCKWNESGFRPPSCTYRLNWARRTSWGWWDEWDDTVLQTQDLKFVPWRSEAEHATSQSQRLPAILRFTRGWGRNIFVSFKPPRPETEPRTLAWKAAVLTTTLGPPPSQVSTLFISVDMWRLYNYVAILSFRLWQLFTVHEWLQFLEDKLFEFDEHIVVIVSIKIIPKSGIFSIANMNLCLCGQKITKCITMLLLHRYKPIQTNSCSSYLLTL